MITEIEITNFKSLRQAKLKLGHLNLFIGPNASGKSNFFDALRLLQGIGYGFTIDEVLNGKPKSATSEVWEGIRGGSRDVAYKQEISGAENPVEFILSLEHKVEPIDYKYNYKIAFLPLKCIITNEELKCNGRNLFSTTAPISASPSIGGRINKSAGSGRGQPPVFDFANHKPLLAQIESHSSCPIVSRAEIEIFRRALGNIQRIDPSPQLLREYSSNRRINRMGERGDNFSALMNVILSDPKNKSSYLTWLQHLTPTEVEDLDILKGPEGDPLIFAIIEKNKKYSAKVLSDGTLRFAAITASFFQPDMPDILTIEEIENGIHPSRLRLLMELLKSQTRDNLQVMATTHSPLALAWLDKSDYSTTFFCMRNVDDGASIIRPLSEIEPLKKAIERTPLSDLFADGWLESVE